MEILPSIKQEDLDRIPTEISGYPVTVHKADHSEGAKISLRESELIKKARDGHCHTEFKIQSSDGKGSVSADHSTSIGRDMSQGSSIDTSAEDVMRVINKYADDLMDKHSNLVGITASYFKSSGFRKGDTRERKLEQKPIIALYCRIKGFVPVNEEYFPSILDGYETDVREGVVYSAAHPKADEYHNNLRVGCAVGAPEMDFSGTLGPFLDHPKFGVCAISCAHLFVNPSDIDEFIRSESLKQFLVERKRESMAIHQPPSSASDRIGYLIEARISRGRSSEGRPGSDCALIKIQTREPVDGLFPHDDDENIQRIGMLESYHIYYSKTFHSIYKVRVFTYL